MNNKKFGSFFLALGISAVAFAQKTETKTITVTGDGKNSEKMTVVVNGDKISINGKPMNISGFSIDTSSTTVKAFLGVVTEKADKGVRIVEVSNESPAGKAGLKQGDIIRSINETAISSPEELMEIIGKFKPETKVAVDYLRDGIERKTTAVLGKRITNSNIRVITSDGPEFHFKMPPVLGENFRFDKRLGLTPRPKLGIKIEDLEDGSGVKITDVDAELPGGKSGLKENDIITEVNGKAVTSVDNMREQIKDLKEGDTVKLGIRRNGKSETIEIRLPKKLKTANL